MAPSLSNDLLQPQLRRIASAGQLLTKTSRKYKDSLKSIARPLLRSIHPLPGHDIEFPHEAQTIVSWAVALMDRYTSFDERRSEGYRKRLSTLALKELNWYKEVHDAEYEFVVATIADPEYGVDRFIRLDRDAAPPPEFQEAQVPKPFSIRKSTMSSFSTASSSSTDSSYSRASYSSSGYSSPASSFTHAPTHACGPTGSADTIWVLDELPDPEKDRRLRLMERLAFRAWQNGTPPPTLLDVALIAKATHDNDDHHLWPAECLWFSTMIVRVLQQAGFCYVVAYRDSAHKFQVWMGDAAELESGSFKARSVRHEQQGVIEDILLSYRNTRERVMERMGEAAKHVAYRSEQRLLVDETMAQRDAAMALAAEASASAAEAAARAKEAQALAVYESRLRAKAEEIAERQARRNAASQAELMKLRRQLSEMQLGSRSAWVNRKITPRE